MTKTGRIGMMNWTVLEGRCIKQCREYLVPDLLVSVELLGAVTRGAEAIAAANVALLESSAQRAELRNILSKAVEDARVLYARIKSV